MRRVFALRTIATTGSRRRWLLIPGVLVGALVVGVAIAVGAIPGSDGVIHSCYNTGSNPSGLLRVIDTAAGGKCSKNEKALNFNQTGPTGPMGATGATGATGAAGTSTVYTAGGTGPGPTAVSVAAGNYLVGGSAVLFNNSNPAGSRTAACTLTVENSDPPEETIVANVTLGSVGFATVPIVGTAVFPVVAGDISFECAGADIGTARTFLSATRFDSIVTP